MSELWKLPLSACAVADNGKISLKRGKKTDDLHSKQSCLRNLAGLTPFFTSSSISEANFLTLKDG